MAPFYCAIVRGRLLLLEVPGEVGHQPARLAPEVEDLVQGGGQRPWTTTARAGASPLFGGAQAAYPVEIVIGGNAAQELQPSGEIAAPAMKAAAHLADFVQGGVLGNGAVHLQLIAGLPIFLPLDDLLVVTVGDGGQPIERDGGEVIATAQGRQLCRKLV